MRVMLEIVYILLQIGMLNFFLKENVFEKIVYYIANVTHQLFSLEC